jgi:DNA polymerase III alpha subunit
VWGLVTGFAGYAFCKAHSTAYGVEAYQSAWLKCNYPAEFMAAVLTNGKGFYAPLVYVLEFHGRVRPTPEEMEAMIPAGGFDEFGQTRTRQFWEAQHLQKTGSRGNNLEFDFDGKTNPVDSFFKQHPSLLREPARHEQLEAETELFGYAVSGHPLELFANIAWDTYCPVSRLDDHIGETVVTCGLVVEQRTHHQITGEAMKFLKLADWTGMVETELFAQTYKSYGLATVRYPVLEVTAKVEPFENGRGFSLRVLRADKPRQLC